MNPPTSNRVRSIWERFSTADDGDFIFVTDLLIHEVETKVEILVDEPIDELERFVLEAVQFANPPNVEQIDELLSLGRQIVFRLCQSFCARGLLERDAGEYRVTKEGNEVLRTGTEKKKETGIKTFHFLHPTMQFIPRHHLPADKLRRVNDQTPASNWKFSASTIDELISLDADKKQACGFPREVQRRLTHEELVRLSDGISSKPTPEPILISNRAVSIPVIGVANGGSVGSLIILLYPYIGGDANDEALLTLTEKDAVTSVFSEYLPDANAVEVEEAWKNVCFDNMLESPESAAVSLENGLLSIELSSELILRWRQFLKSNARIQAVSPVACGKSLRLCPLKFSGADHAASNQLRLLKLLIELSGCEDRDSLFKSELSLLNWCRSRTRAPLDSIRELAGCAFDFGEFETALSVSEMEDMVDAAV